MEKVAILKDGKKVIIRELHINDLDKLMKFYSALPSKDRKYLRIDVTNRKIVEQRIKLIKSDNVFRLVALFEGEIIADGSLELSAEEWRKHQGELRVIVARPLQHKGLGMIIVRELYFLAVEKKVELVVVKMMRPQIAAQRIFRKLGFREELLIPDYVEDRSGEKQDLIIMTCNIKDLWNELEHFYSDSDWQRCR
ncbi:MAG: GNAT family N-acetyltransferase [Candidatus Aminicenantaceae bacterium]